MGRLGTPGFSLTTTRRGLALAFLVLSFTLALTAILVLQSVKEKVMVLQTQTTALELSQSELKNLIESNAQLPGELLRTVVILPIIPEAFERFQFQYGPDIPECAEAIPLYQRWFTEPEEPFEVFLCFGITLVGY